MTAKFYLCNCPPEVIDKTTSLTGETSASVANYEPIDDISGYLYMGSSFDNFNYCKLENKYYFIGPREFLTNGLCRIHLTEDVLYTHKDAALNTPCMVARANAGCNPYFRNDLPTLVFTRNSETSQPALEYDHNNQLYYVLVTAGNGTSYWWGRIASNPDWEGWG